MSAESSVTRRDFVERAVLAAGGFSVAATSGCGPQGSAGTPSPLDQGFRLFREVHGDGPAVVFAHGAGGTHMSWWRQVPTFSREFKCIIYDQRRFGLSPDVPNGPGALAWVEDLRRMLDELGIERASLVGQSAGGRSVLGFAAAYPDRVEKLVMASTWGGYTDAELRSSYWGLEVAAVLASAPNLGPSRNFAPSYFERDPEGVFLYEMISRTNQSAADESAPRAVTPVPDIQRIIAARVPTLVIVGERDTVAPPAVTKAFQAKMTGSRLVTFEDCGHSAYWEMHEDFNRVVLEFLRA